MCSRNMEKLLFHLSKDGAFAIDNLAQQGDEIVRGSLITRSGDIVHEGARAALVQAERVEAKAS
jgi:hypothetical protein